MLVLYHYCVITALKKETLSTLSIEENGCSCNDLPKVSKTTDATVLRGRVAGA